MLHRRAINKAAWSSALLLAVLWTLPSSAGVVSSEVVSTDLNGDDLASVRDYPDVVTALALDAVNEKLYAANQGSGGSVPDGEISRMNLDGSDFESVVTGVFAPEGLATDPAAQHVYWTEGEEQAVRRADYDGTNQVTLVTLNEPTGQVWPGLALDLDAGKVYWSGFRKVWRADLDGSNVEELVNRVNTIWIGLALDLQADRLYLGGSSEGLFRAELDGSNLTELPTDRAGAIALDLAASKVYYTDSLQDRVGRSNLDGTGAEELLEIFRPSRLALDVGDGRLYFVYQDEVPTVPATSTAGLVLLCSVVLLASSAALIRRRELRASRGQSRDGPVC